MSEIIEEENRSLKAVEKNNIQKLDIETLKNEYPELVLKIQKTMKINMKSHSGPLPDPETLKGYKQAYKDAPEIIFKMATNEQSFRHFSTYMGQASALLMGLCGLGVTAYLGVNGHPWLAGVIGFGSLGSLVGVFLHQKKK